MIITAIGSGDLDLTDRGNFRELKVVSNLPADELLTALSPLGRVEGDHLWIAPGTLQRWGGVEQPPEWCEAFERMVQSVKRFGWVGQDGSVRAHIERLEAQS